MGIDLHISDQNIREDTRIHSHFRSFSIIFYNVPGIWHPAIWRTMPIWSRIPNATVADHLAMQGAKASTTSVMKMTFGRFWCGNTSGLNLGLRPANERRRYKITPSLIGWAQTWSQLCRRNLCINSPEISIHRVETQSPHAARLSWGNILITFKFERDRLIPFTILARFTRY